MSALFSPGRIGGLDLENRVVVSPMCQYSAVDGTAQPWHLIHIGNLMMSSAGLVIMEATAVAEIGRGTHGCLGLYTGAHEKALGFRMNSTDWHPEGFMLDDAIALARELETASVDYVVMSSGNIAPGIAIPPASPGHQVPFATTIKQHTKLTAMAVGMIAKPHEAETIIADGHADFVALARPMLDNPRWAVHAAAAFGVDIRYPPQYVRIRPNNWLGFTYVHPEANPPATGQQLDRPAGTAWDRPKPARDLPTTR